MKPPLSSSSSANVETKMEDGRVVKSVSSSPTDAPSENLTTVDDASLLVSDKKPTVRFPHDLAAHLSSLGPGNFLSRSQDNLSGHGGSSSKRKGSIPTSKRPQSSLGIPKGSTNGVGKVTSRTMSSAQLTRKSNSPISEKPTTTSTSKEIKHSDFAKSSKKHVYASQQVADARINRTKLTVTELQKQKQELESHVSDLVKKAEYKQAELATMKMEIRRLKEEKSEECEKWMHENEVLKQKLRACRPNKVEDCNEDASASMNGKVFIDVGTSPIVTVKQMMSDECATDSDEAVLPGVSGSSNRAAAEWDRQSTSSEVSVACLQDRIFQMEETHYSTNEELQATLQELTDLQDIVNDLTHENQNLSEEKALLYDSLCKQSQKVDNCRLQIENLKHLLLSGNDLRLNRVASSLASTVADGKTSTDREQQLIDLLKNAHEEHEELLCKFEEIRSAYRMTDEEKREQQEMLEILKDRARLLEAQLEHANIERKTLEENVFECKQHLDKDKREIMRITNAYEKEKCRVEELLRHSNAKDKDDMQNLLDSVRADKDRAEDRVNALEECLTSKNAEIEKLTEAKQKLEMELKFAHEDNEKTEIASEEKSRELERENEIVKKQLVELKNAVLDLTERCQRHADDKKEYRVNILTLQKTVDDLSFEREKLRKDVAELTSARQQDAEEWKQFQADLQVAVVVANDFKIEAQEDIERLSAENFQLRDKVSTLNQEVEKMRNVNRTSPTKVPTRTPPVSSPAAVPTSPDIRARVDDYLSSVERISNNNIQQVQQETKIVSSPTVRPKLSDVINAANNCGAGSLSNKCVLSVRALVESLESASSHHTGFRVSPSSSMRSPGAGRNEKPSVIRKSSSGTPDVDGLSKSSGNLVSRPVSLESVDLPLKPQLKAAISEGEVQCLSPVLRGSPQKPVSTTFISESVGGDDVENRQPRGILRNQQQLPRKVAYLDLENKDPLAKLMKDAPRGSRRNALLRWCQNRTIGYKNVEITNFSSSWNDGLAFCALMHSFVPNKVPYFSLDTKDKRRNFTIAFQAAQEVGIAPSLNVDEMMSLERPDWQSVMSYVTAIYKHFEI